MDSLGTRQATNFKRWLFDPNTPKRIVVTLEVETSEEMEVLAKEENRTLTNWIGTAALMELKSEKAA